MRNTKTKLIASMMATMMLLPNASYALGEVKEVTDIPEYKCYYEALNQIQFDNISSRNQFTDLSIFTKSGRVVNLPNKLKVDTNTDLSAGIDSSNIVDSMVKEPTSKSEFLALYLYMAKNNIGEYIIDYSSTPMSDLNNPEFKNNILDAFQDASSAQPELFSDTKNTTYYIYGNSRSTTLTIKLFSDEVDEVDVDTDVYLDTDSNESLDTLEDVAKDSSVTPNEDADLLDSVDTVKELDPSAKDKDFLVEEPNSKSEFLALYLHMAKNNIGEYIIDYPSTPMSDLNNPEFKNNILDAFQDAYTAQPELFSDITNTTYSIYGNSKSTALTIKLFSDEVNGNDVDTDTDTDSSEVNDDFIEVIEDNNDNSSTDTDIASDTDVDTDVASDTDADTDVASDTDVDTTSDTDVDVTSDTDVDTIEVVDSSSNDIIPKLTLTNIIKDENSLVKQPTTEAEFLDVYFYMAQNNKSEYTINYPNTPFRDITDPAFTNKILTAFDNAFEIYPEYFSFTNKTSYNLSGSSRGSSITIKLYNENYSDRDINSMKSQFTTKVKNIVQNMIDSGKLTSDMTDKEKAKVLYTYLIQNAKYDETFAPVSFTGYGLVTNGYGVCQAYTATYNLMLKLVGIDVRGVKGLAGKDYKESHIWSLAKLDGTWEYIDTTWGDPIGLNDDDYVDYTYFCIKEEVLRNTHEWSTN